MNGSYESVLKSWVPSMPDIGNCLKQYNNNIIMFLSIFTKRFTNFKLADTADSMDALTTGSGCFIGSIIISLCQCSSLLNLDELAIFAEFYMTLDHFIDDDSIIPGIKQQVVHKLKEFVVNPVLSEDFTHPVYISITTGYLKLLESVPSCKNYLRDAFMAEILAQEFQKVKNSYFSRQTYLDIASWKGGATVEAIQAILGLPVNEHGSDEYDLGSVMQLQDDLSDINDDIKDKIITVVTYELSTVGNVDQIVKYTIEKIGLLDSKYNIFKPILLIMVLRACLGKGGRPNIITNPLKTILQSYYTNDSLMEDKDEVKKMYYDKLKASFKYTWLPDNACLASLLPMIKTMFTPT